MSNVIVTGGAGFVGTNLIKRLLKDGHDVTSIDNYCTGRKENEQEGCKYYDYNIVKTTNFVDFLEEQDVIFHLAALARIQPSIKNPIKALQNNVIGTMNILEHARNNNVQVIYAGSSSKHHNLYGSPYAFSKWNGEELCKLYSNVYDVNSVICRFYNVYGPHQIEDGDYSTVIGIFERQHRNKENLTITGDGEQRRDFTHVDDIVDGLIACTGKDFRGDEFELGRGKNFSINEVANLFGGEKEYIPARPGEYPTTLCDYSKAHKELDWKPYRNLEDYVSEVIND